MPPATNSPNARSAAPTPELSGGVELLSQIEKFGRRPDDLSQKTKWHWPRKAAMPASPEECPQECGHGRLKACSTAAHGMPVDRLRSGLRMADQWYHHTLICLRRAGGLRFWQK